VEKHTAMDCGDMFVFGWSTASEERDGRVFHVDCEKRAGLASGPRRPGRLTRRMLIFSRRLRLTRDQALNRKRIGETGGPQPTGASGLCHSPTYPVHNALQALSSRHVLVAENSPADFGESRDDTHNLLALLRLCVSHPPTR
jgi:hypothetical protein